MHSKYTKSFFLLVTLLAGFGSIFSEKNIRLDEDEIRRNAQPAEFENKNRRLAPDYLKAGDLERGQKFGEEILANDLSKNHGFILKRIFDQSTPGLGADIMVISESASFGHIHVLERTISGYLRTAFEYNSTDAAFMARMILYYNIVLRQNHGMIPERYAENVVSEIDLEKAGIDRSFKNWAGQTEIVIPLKKNLVRPDESDLSTGEIKEQTQGVLPPADEKRLADLREERRQEDSSRLDEKSRELAATESKVVEEKKTVEAKDNALAEKQKAIATEKKVVEEKAQALQEEKKKTDTALAQEKAKPAAEQDQKKIADLEQKSAQKQSEIAKTEEKKQELVKEEKKTEAARQETAASQKQLAKEEATVKKQQTQAAAQKSEIAQERKKDNQQLPESEKDKKLSQLTEENTQLRQQEEERKQKSENVVGEKIVFLRIVRNLPDGHYNNELWMIDPVNEASLYRSAFNKICGKQFINIPGQGILVLGYQGDATNQGDHNMVLLDPDTLAFKKASESVLHWVSPIIYRDDKIYAFEIVDGEYYLTRFNSDLSVDKRSNKPVNPYSELSFYYEKIFLTGHNHDKPAETTIDVFSRGSLEHMRSIIPPK